MTSEYVNATGLQRKAFFPRAPGIDLDSEGGAERIGKQVQWEKKGLSWFHKPREKGSINAPHV